MSWISITALTVFLVLCVITFKVYFQSRPKQSFDRVKFIARVAIFGAMSAILYVVPVFQFPLGIFPSFLELHFDEVPAFIASFAYGPWTGLAVVAIKTVVKLPFSTTMCVGELTDLLLSGSYVVIAGLIYQKKRNFKGVFLAFLISTIWQLVFSMVLNVYVMIPFYMNLMGFPEGALLSLMQQAIPAIKDVGWSYSLLAVLPFNLIKDGLVLALTFIIYRSLHVFLRYKKA